MSLLNFVSDEDKEKLIEIERQRISKVKDNYFQQGLNGYQVERKMEMITCLPDELPSFEAAESNLFHNVTFSFNKEEYEKFASIFLVSSYVENNCSQNWLIMKLCDLIKSRKIYIDYSKKDVIING